LLPPAEEGVISGPFFLGFVFFIRVGALSFQQILQKFFDSSSNRIFRRMYGVLNIDENKKLIIQFGRN
jgi:hypothetical protein